MPVGLRREMWVLRKVFLYELRRLLLNKGYWGLAAVSLVLGSQVLRSAVILGVADTAPFSPWSFGSYLAQLMPLLSVLLVFLLWNQCAEKTRGLEVLAQATPTPPQKLLFAKCGAVAVAWLLLTVLVVGLGIGFLVTLFGADVPLGSFVLPALLTLIPPLFLLMGAGLWIGRARPALLFVLMAVVFLLGFVPLPASVELYGTALFTEYPLTLEVLDPAFRVPFEALAAKSVYILLGVGMASLAMRKVKRHPSAIKQ